MAILSGDLFLLLSTMYKHKSHDCSGILVRHCVMHKKTHQVIFYQWSPSIPFNCNGQERVKTHKQCGKSIIKGRCQFIIFFAKFKCYTIVYCCSGTFMGSNQIIFICTSYLHVWPTLCVAQCYYLVSIVLGIKHDRDIDINFGLMQ